MREISHGQSSTQRRKQTAKQWHHWQASCANWTLQPRNPPQLSSPSHQIPPDCSRYHTSPADLSLRFLSWTKKRATTKSKPVLAAGAATHPNRVRSPSRPSPYPISHPSLLLSSPRSQLH